MTVDLATEHATHQPVAPTDPRAEFTRGLREVADWLDAHPDVPLPYIDAHIGGEWLNALPIYVSQYKKPREAMAAIARAMGRAEKVHDDTLERLRLVRRFAGIAVVASADRAAVCERVVVATGTVTKEVPDPDALAAVPKVTVTETVEQVEWRCGSLLAGGSVSS